MFDGLKIEGELVYTAPEGRTILDFWPLDGSIVVLLNNPAELIAVDFRAPEGATIH